MYTLSVQKNQLKINSKINSVQKIQKHPNRVFSAANLLNHEIKSNLKTKKN